MPIGMGGGGLQPAAPAVTVLGASSTRLLVNASTTSIPPVYATLLSGTLTTIDAASNLYIAFTGALLHQGPNGANVAPNIRVRLNGALVTPGGGNTVNMVANRIMPITYSLRVGVTAGLQTVVVEWAAFALGANTLLCMPASIPDLMHAQLLLEEHRIP